MYEIDPQYSLDPHQIEAVNFIESRTHGGAGYWAEPGLGKGFVGVYLIVKWLNEHEPGYNRILVTAPASLVHDWKNKLYQFAHIDASIWDEDENHVACVQLISHNLLQEPKATSKSKRRNRVPEIIDWTPDAIIVDEAHKFKTYGSSQTKGLLRIVRKTLPRKRLMLTATPTTTIDPEELRPQLQVICEPLLEALGVNDWHSWRKKYAVIKKERFGDTVVEKVTGVQNQDHLDIMLKRLTLKQTADILNLPEKVFRNTTYGMSPKAQKLWTKMATEGSILTKDLEVVTSTPLDRAIKCAMLRSGFITDFDKKVHEIDTNMISTTMELVAGSPLPLLVVYNFRHTGDRLEAALTAAGYRVGHIRGGVSGEKKVQIENDFQAGKYDIVLGQWQAISLGLTFTRGHHIICAEPTFSLECWLQTIGRINRRGQTRTCFYHRLCESMSLDKANYEALDNKQDFADLITRNVVRLLPQAA